jgi:CxxC motif-containing protein (DUF1111 family)
VSQRNSFAEAAITNSGKHNCILTAQPELQFGRRGHRVTTIPIVVVWVVFAIAAIAPAQIDPGPRGGPSDAGGPYEKLGAEELNLYWASRDRFKEVDSVSGTIERGVGLGPTFNGNSCAGCHAQPAAGGSSPGPRSPQVSQLALKEGRLALVPQTNPQVGLAKLDRAPNGDQTVPPFLTADGPVRVARFITRPDGTLDGSVHDIYTIAGRIDASGCVLPQPDFAGEIERKNLAFRIPTPTFGGGLIEAVPDPVLLANLGAAAKQKHELGIVGRFNRTVNDGTISRFGWKAQNKSLLLFAAESYNVEQGVTSELFPDERDGAPGCQFNPIPEDTIKLQMPPGATYQPSSFASDVVNFGAFMRLLAPPKPATFSTSAAAGAELFNSVGCALCHSPTLTTGRSPFTGMSHIEIHPYSDFALHHMGPGLADHISQGLAAGDEFRTAPLWGVGQRIFFLHDGRTSNLVKAIEAHTSADRNCRTNSLSGALNEACGSEANGVLARFNALSISQKQNVIDFLRSL